MKKLNEKYAGQLSEEQRGMIRAYAFSTANDDVNSIKKKLVEVKQRLLRGIAEFSRQNVEHEYVNKKMDEARQRIEGETLEVVDDDTVSRFMLYAQLNSELTEES